MNVGLNHLIDPELMAYAEESRAFFAAAAALGAGVLLIK